jgi:hypothetical protein
MYLVILINEGSRDFLPQDLPENGISSFSSHLARAVSFPYSVFLTYR